MPSSGSAKNPADFLVSWYHTTLADDREVIDGLVAPEHRAPSAELAAALAIWSGAWYWADDAHSRLILVRGQATPRPERWLWHAALLLITTVCALGAGAIIQGRVSPPRHQGLTGLLLSIPQYAEFVAGGGWRVILSGWVFALPLLLILLIHELGHYFTARRYAIDVSPPYFIPVPPNLSPIGGMGAFIRLRTPLYDRLQLLEVGAAGPLAGFLVAWLVLAWGLTLSSRVGGQGHELMVLYAGSPIWLGNSLLTSGMTNLLVPGDGPLLLSPVAFAGWVGIFVTGLNLLPLSQLDGGHVAYGLIGRRQKYLAMATALILLLLGSEASMWYLWVGFTLLIGGGRWSHPEVVAPGRAVPRRSRLIGWATLAVFLLTFIPVPFRV